MSGTEAHDRTYDFQTTTEEEYDHMVKKQIRQLEGEHKVEKAVLEQKIELLEMKVSEFEQREANLKRTNSEILMILNDLNRKEDSALMHKVFEELALANKEKDWEKEQQQCKIQAVKNHLELNIREAKEKLEQSEKEKKEMEAEHKMQIMKYERELENEKRAHEMTRRELMKRKAMLKGEDIEILKKRMASLEDENGHLKKEYEKEMSKLKFQFERNLAELKKIHNEERHSFENRLKKTKEIVAKVEAENESKAVVENQLVQEVALLKEKIAQLEAKKTKEVEKAINERNAAIVRVKELEEGVYESPCKKPPRPSSSNNDPFVKSLEERLKVLEEKEQASASKAPTVRGTNKSMHLEQSSPDQAHTLANFDSRIPSLADSIIHEPHVVEPKKSVAPIQTENPIQYWSTDDRVKPFFSKPNTRTNSRHDLSYISQPQTSTCCYSEFENRTNIPRPFGVFPEKLDSLHSGVKINTFVSSKDLDNIDSYSVLKDTSHIRGNWGDQGTSKRQSCLTTEGDYATTYTSETPLNTDFGLPALKESWSYNKLRNIKDKSQVGVRVNYPERVYIKPEAPRLRRNASHGIFESSLVRDLSNEKMDLYKEEPSQYDSTGKIKTGIYDVINGLDNIKTRLARQREDIVNAKNESIREISKGRRSFSNVRLRPSVNAGSLFTEGNYRPFEATVVYGTPLNTNELSMNKTIYLGDENNSSNLHGGLSSSFGETVQVATRTRTPVLLRDSGKIIFHHRHRNSLA